MALFNKRETLVQNIAYMALMAAINVIFVLLTAVLPPLMFLIVFILPLTSAIVTLFCKKRYFPIYFVVTVGLCLLTTSAIYIWDTFFYVLPSLITGFVFGALVEKRVPALYIILISTILQYVISFLTFLILDAILPELNFIDALLNIFGLGEFAFKTTFVHIFLYVLSSIQTAFAYFIIRNEIKKLGFEVNLEIKLPILLFGLTLVICAAAVVMIFVYDPLVYVFIAMNLPLLVYQIIDIIFTRSKLNYILGGIALIIGAAIFIGFYNFLPHPNAIILLAPLYVLIGAIYFGNYLFNKETKNDKINC